MYINRHIETKIIEAKDMFKVVLITGPRQVGKTTTLRHLFGSTYNYVTLDDINALDIAKHDPKLFFRNYSLPLIIDEVQLSPSLFHEIKRMVDESDQYGQLILTGSQTFHLMQNISETLAGRIGIIEFSGLSYREINGDNFLTPFIPSDAYISERQPQELQLDLWYVIHRGSMPELYNKKDLDWQMYYASYVRTYIERDVRSLLEVRNLDVFTKFMIALASRTGQLINYASISNEIGVDIKTVQSWTKVLEASGIILIVPPFTNNALKRVVKTPMIYFLNTGLVSYLLKWYTKDTLQNGAMSGLILETYVIGEITKSFRNNGYIDVPITFYRDKDMKEIDVIIEHDGILYPIEIKKTMNPNKSMAKQFKLLHKALGFSVNNELILCLSKQRIFLSETLLAFPIEEI
jgi:predicted AAA+ superfamily ATPase